MRIGVVIPAYNAAPWIGDAIASVLAQSHSDWRLVVVDDGSTDNTACVPAMFSDARIRLVRQANAGVSVARNAGVAALLQPASSAAPDAFLFLDADDRLAPTALTRLAATLLAAPGAVAACGACQLSGTGTLRIPAPGNLLPELLVRNRFVNAGHVLLRRSAVVLSGGFLPGLAYGEDWEFLIRIALQGPFAAVVDRVPVLFVHQHACGAYQRMAAEPGAFAPCMAAIFANPALLIRFGRERLAAFRRAAEAENVWVAGRERIRHGRSGEGLSLLRSSVRARPGIRRLGLLLLAHLAVLLPPTWRGRLQPYGGGRASTGVDVGTSHPSILADPCDLC